MKNANETDVLLEDDELIEKGFNDALSDLQKSLDSEGGLFKAKKPPKAKANKDEDEEKPGDDEDDEEPDDDEDDYEESHKSVEDILEEDVEAGAAMEIEPFLRQLAKAIDEVVDTNFRSVRSMIKSQGAALVAVGQLNKSTRDLVKSMGDAPVRSNSLRRLNKSSRFGDGDKAVEMDGLDILVKSRTWVQERKIDLIEAGNLEGRINKGLVGKVGDALDKKVAALIQEGK